MKGMIHRKTKSNTQTEKGRKNRETEREQKTSGKWEDHTERERGRVTESKKGTQT